MYKYPFLSLQLTEEEQTIFRTGTDRIIPNGDRSGRGVAVIRLSDQVVPNNAKSLPRLIWYANSIVEDDPIMQQKGIVTVPYFGVQWKSSPFQVLRVASTYPIHAQPFHEVSIHVVYNDPTKHDMIQTIRNVFPEEPPYTISFAFWITVRNGILLEIFWSRCFTGSIP